ncbi:MAG: Lrp/AsnC family transcriptional regulator [Chitinophagaceae bacterium]|nr:Lrp/AsnC family transcriptional regulator [Chitinophagaceae bacterium]
MPDDIDKHILNLLQENAMLTIRDIADRLSLTTTPVHERIKKLEKEGVIIGYRAIIDAEKVDKAQVVLLNLRMEDYTPKNIAAFEKMISGMPQVLECFHLAGTVDYQLKVIVKDIKEYDSFLMKMAKISIVSVVSSMIVLHRVKQSTYIQL